MSKDLTTKQPLHILSHIIHKSACHPEPFAVWLTQVAVFADLLLGLLGRQPEAYRAVRPSTRK